MYKKEHKCLGYTRKMKKKKKTRLGIRMFESRLYHILVL